MYKFYNNNPFNRNISDCVIRCLALLKNKSWEEMYNELVDLSGDIGMLFNEVSFVEDYLDDRYKRICHYSKTVGEFAKEYSYGKYAVTMDGHITAIIDGVIYDTFNPSNRIMRCAWEIK